MKRFLILRIFLAVFFFICHSSKAAQISMEDNSMGMGIPLEEDVDADFDICPQGARVIAIFLDAWAGRDYEKMYELLDNDSKKDYPFDEARMDFEALRFKEYKLSFVRRDGENFIFILNYGDWQTADKETKKMVISGRTFKIIMPTKNSPFKDSIENYF